MGSIWLVSLAEEDRAVINAEHVPSFGSGLLAPGSIQTEIELLDKKLVYRSSIWIRCGIVMLLPPMLKRSIAATSKGYVGCSLLMPKYSVSWLVGVLIKRY